MKGRVENRVTSVAAGAPLFGESRKERGSDGERKGRSNKCRVNSIGTDSVSASCPFDVNESLPCLIFPFEKKKNGKMTTNILSQWFIMVRQSRRT